MKTPTRWTLLDSIEDKGLPEFKVNWWIKNESTPDVRELVTRELSGNLSTPGLGSAPPPDYFGRMHKYTVVIELPGDITETVGDGALVVDLHITDSNDQTEDGVDLLTTGPKLEYISKRQSWSSAETFCVSKGGHLTSVSSSYHWKRLQKFISKEGLTKTSIWLGGTDVESEGHWRWTDGSKWSEEHWKRGRGNIGTTKNCLSIDNGEWLDNRCNYAKSSICELPTTKRITADTRIIFTSENISLSAIQLTWTTHPLDDDQKKRRYEEEWGDMGSQLYYEKVKRNWREAESHCASKGGHLASVSSQEDWERLQAFVTMIGIERKWIWLGGRKDVTDGNWTWSDGSEWSEEHWRVGWYYDHPERNCLGISDVEWYDKECMFEFDSICNLLKDEKGDTQAVIGGYNVKWHLRGNKNSTENVNVSKTGFWKVKKGQDLSTNLNLMFLISLVQEGKIANLPKELVWVAILKYRWRREIILDSPCLNESQIFDVIFRAGHDLDLKPGYTPWIRDDDLTFGMELYTVLHYCPSHLVESSKMFVFFEHLITHHSLKTLLAATMNSIAPRADKMIRDFSSINMWYKKLDNIYKFALGPLLATFSTTKQLGLLRTLTPPFLSDYDQRGDKEDCKEASFLPGKDPPTAKLISSQVVVWLISATHLILILTPCLLLPSFPFVHSRQAW